MYIQLIENQTYLLKLNQSWLQILTSVLLKTLKISVLDQADFWISNLYY